MAGRGCPRLNPCRPMCPKTPSESAQADSQPQASAPRSGSHLGPHTRPQCPCNKAASKEAVGSFVHARHRRLLIHQPQTCIEVLNDEYEFSLPRRGSPFKELGVCSVVHGTCEEFGCPLVKALACRLSCDQRCTMNFRWHAK